MGSTAVMNIMLGWLKGIARWVLGLFNLAGVNAFSPLEWLSRHWATLLIVLLITGVALDLIIWLVRWRPYWVWFNKKRIVIDDDDFFAGEELVDSGLYDPSLFEVAPGQRSRTRPSTNVPRRAVLIERVDENGNPVRRAHAERRRPRREIRSDDPIFNISPEGDWEAPSNPEDEVFNVSDLPVSRDEIKFQKKRRSRG